MLDTMLDTKVGRVLAVVCLVLAAAAVLSVVNSLDRLSRNGRYHIDGELILDTQTGELCTIIAPGTRVDGCFARFQPDSTHH